MAAWPSGESSSASDFLTDASRSHPSCRAKWSSTSRLICARAARRACAAGRDVNLALKDISHNLGRFLLTCLGLSLLLGIVLAMVGIYRGLIVESLGLVRAAGAQIWVVEGDTRGPFAEASPHNERRPTPRFGSHRIPRQRQDDSTAPPAAPAGVLSHRGHHQ